MGEFDDLFERAIPREVALDYVRELQKLAVSMGWVHKATTRAARNAPTDRLLEVAGRSARGARNAAQAGNSSAVKKRLLLKNKALDEALYRPATKAAELALLKEAVSTEWVSRAARSGAQSVSRGRLGEVADRSMKGVLGAAKTKGPLRQAHLDKRMALRNNVLGGQAARVDTVRPPAFSKAASYSLKLAVAAEKVRQSLEPSAEQVMLAERTGMMQQAAQENVALRQELEQSQALIEEHAQAAEQAQAMAQQTQEDLAQAQAMAQQTQMQAEDAMAQAQEQAAAAQQEAQLQASEAAAQADGKMRLAIRIQQIRQQLADMASQDPVTEEGEQADPISTSMQQGMGDPSMDPSADPAAAGQDPAAAAPEGGVPPGAGAEAGGPPAGAQGEAAPKPKPKAKPKADKSESKAPKTEIKIGSKLAAAQNIARAKGIVGRGKQLLTGSRRDALLGSAKRNSQRVLGNVEKHLAAMSDDAEFERMTRKQNRNVKHLQSVAREYGSEKKKVIGTRAGTALGVTGVTGVGIHKATKGRREGAR
jgi:hypothetical protein